MKTKIKILIKKLIDETFELGILIKFFFGIFEVLAGFLMAMSGKLAINNLIIALTQQEILDDPNDFLANYLIKISNSLFTGGHAFAIFYLIFHGVFNIFLVIALLKNKIWVYPWAAAGFSFFMFYQVFRYFHTYSLLLLFLIIFDLFIISIILLEYKNKKKK